MGVELDQRELEVGIALGDTAADQLADELPGANPAYTDCVTIRSDADASVIGLFTCAAESMATLSVEEAGSLTLTPPVCVWKKACEPLVWAAAQTGSKSRE